MHVNIPSNTQVLDNIHEIFPSGEFNMALSKVG